MNRRRSLGPALVSLFVILSIAGGCSTFGANPPNKQALQILDTIRASVASAVVVFNAQVSTGKVPEPTRLKAIDLRKKYLDADDLAVKGLAVTIKQTPAEYTASVSALASALIAFVNELVAKPQG